METSRFLLYSSDSGRCNSFTSQLFLVVSIYTGIEPFEILSACKGRCVIYSRNNHRNDLYLYGNELNDLIVQ